LITAVVLTWNGRADTLTCLRSLDGVHVVCVDNGSTDGTAEAVAREQPAVELIQNRTNLGFAAGNNVGIRRAVERGADWVLLLNNDAVAEPGLVAALEGAAATRPDAGALACKVVFAERPDTVEYAGARFRLLLGYRGRQRGYGQRDAPRFSRLSDVGWATGAAMAVSRTAIDRVGLLDERLFAYVEDVDWCLRIRHAGFGIVFVPDARVRHRGATSFGGRASPGALYYHARNTLAVCERHRPLPRGLCALRRGVVVGTHLFQARRRDGARAVVQGWRDYRAGRMGARA
jgi:GT2 family glycosyltransferase